MTKAKAKLFIQDLLDLDLTPELRVDNGEYIVTVNKIDGATTAQVQALEVARGVTASVTRVKFV